MPDFPNVELILLNWWGGTFDCPAFFSTAAVASNLLLGGNPVYQLSNFFAMYPKFGSWTQGLDDVSIAAAGSGYTAGDVLTVTGGNGGTVSVDTVDGSGTITGISVKDPGSGYSAATAVVTTGGTGTGATVDINAITGYSSLIPQVVLQAYLNLATASLQKARWAEAWELAVALFIAHFATLYLQSEGAFLPGQANAQNTSAQQVALSGLSHGIVVSNGAGDVSESYMPLQELDGWAAWRLTEYGQQLATFAKIYGMGPMYIY